MCGKYACECAGALVPSGEAFGFRRGVGAASSSGSNRGTKDVLDRLRGVASQMGLSSSMVQEAVSILKEVCAWCMLLGRSSSHACGWAAL